MAISDLATIFFVLVDLIAGVPLFVFGLGLLALAAYAGLR
jgi:hypothetical protein